jgi:hypothetical protein
VAGRLLPQVQADDVVRMDRGFWSYRLFGQIWGRGAFSAVRQRKQANLQTLRQLGPGDRLALWRPQWAASKKAIRELQLAPAMPPRVIDYRIGGFRPSAVVTNLLDAAQVPAAAFVRLALWRGWISLGQMVAGARAARCPKQGAAAAAPPADPAHREPHESSPQFGHPQSLGQG